MPNLSKREAYPADLLRAAPRGVDRDARRVGVVRSATVGADDSAAAVRPSSSTAARTGARSAGGVTTNEPAGNSMPSAVKLFSAIFIGTFFSL